MKNKLIFVLLFSIFHLGLSQDMQFKEWNGTNYGAATVFPANGVESYY